MKNEELNNLILPGFMIIGAQKSGTTFLHRCLQEHPQIFMPKQEIPFFETPNYENNDISDLGKYFSNVSRQKIKGIKRPDYLGSPEVPDRIIQKIPNAKLIVILRDPIERAISAYFHYIKYGFLPVRSVDKGLQDIIKNFYKGLNKKSNEIIEYGLYYKNLKLYNHFLQRDNLYFIKFDELFNTSQSKIKKLKEVFNYLGVDKSWEPKNIDRRPQKVIYNLKRLVVLSELSENRYQYYYNDRKLKRKTRNFYDKVKIRSFKIIDDHILSKLFINKKPCINKSTYFELKNIYKEDMENLSSYLGIDCSNWMNYQNYKQRHS